MSVIKESSLDTALGFYEAWSTKDLDRAMSFIADDIVVDSPAGRVEGAAAYREALSGWLQMFKRADLLDSFADGERAVVIYTCVTAAVAQVPAVEYFAVEDGKISYKRLIFDRGPFMQAAA